MFVDIAPNGDDGEYRREGRCVSPSDCEVVARDGGGERRKESDLEAARKKRMNE